MTRDEPLGGDDEDTAKSKGELLQQARDWVAAHPGYEFSSNALANYLNAKPGSVQNVIARLVDEGVLKVLVQGAGRRPSVYTANRSPS
jgi:elongation factor P hydroxylase